MTNSKGVVRRIFSLFVTGLLFFSLFSSEVYAVEGDTAFVEFSTDVAGITPDSPWYFIDFVHTPEESLHEAGLMVQEGKTEEAQIALENFASTFEGQRANAEEIAIGDISIDTLASDPALLALYEAQADILNYKIYLDSINSLVAEQETAEQIGPAESVVVEETLQTAENTISSVGAIIESKSVEAINKAARTSNAPSIEADFAFEEGLAAVAEQRYPESSTRFQDIASIQDIQQLKVKISELRKEVADLEESGTTENLDSVRELLRMAESHGVYCLHADESELGITADIHLNAAENFLSDAEGLLEGEIELTALEGELESSETLATEEIQTELQEEEADAVLFTENYDSLKEKYADDPVKLEVIESEKTRLQKVEQLGTLLYDNGVMEKWTAELTGQGLTGNDLEDAIHERWTEEWRALYGEDYVPAGLYETPGEEQRTEGQEALEVVGIGRIDLVKTIDPETGEVKSEIKGWYDGEIVENVREGGGYALGVSYLDPDSGIYYSFGPDSYSYTTRAGIVNVIDYPPEFSTENNYAYGEEVYSYTTEKGAVVSYSATGYEVKDSATEAVLAETPYTEEKTEFSDGSFTDLEPTGYVFNNKDGEARVYAYDAETKSYTDIASGKVVAPPVSPHIEGTIYNPDTKMYSFNYAGQVWGYAGEGAWVSPSGQKVNLPVVPAPVGYESQGVYTTPSGRQWTYDSATNTWTDATSGNSYVSAPHNYYRPDAETGYMLDTRGNVFAPVGTVAIVNGETYTVTADKGWTKEGVAVAPPYDSSTGKQYPSSAVGTGYGYSGGGQGYSGKNWNYDSAKGVWVTADNQESYNPSTGIVTRADGTVVGSENRPAGQGSEGVCYGCYYRAGADSGAHYSYSGGINIRAPDGSYTYYSGGTEGQGVSSPAGTRYTDALGKTWTYQGSGNWVSDSGETVNARSGNSYSERAAVGTTVTGDDGRVYTVTPDRGWTDDQGRAVAPPTVGGMQQPSSVAGGGYGGIYGGYSAEQQAAARAAGYYSAEAQEAAARAASVAGQSPYGYGAYGGGYGYAPGYSPGAAAEAARAEAVRVRDAWVARGGDYYEVPATGGYNSEAAAAGWPGGAYPGGVAPYSGSYQGSVGGYGYGSGYGSGPAYNSPEAWAAAQAAGYASPEAAAAAASGSYYSGGYPGGPGASYPGYSSSGSGAYGGGYDSSGSYVGGSYGGYDSSGSYVGTGGSSGGDSSSTSSTSGGSGSGSSSSGSSGGGDSGSSGGSAGGGDSSSSSAGGSTSGTGGVIAGPGATTSASSKSFFRKIVCFFSRAC